jgi:hypothetical protein
MTTIRDITGKYIEVTDINAAIRQCELCKDSPVRTPSGHTVGENHTYMLKQLNELKCSRRSDNLLSGTKRKMEQGKRLTKEDMAYEIGRIDAYHPAHLYWDKIKREEILKFFNDLFGTAID